MARKSKQEQIDELTRDRDELAKALDEERENAGHTIGDLLNAREGLRDTVRGLEVRSVMAQESLAVTIEMIDGLVANYLRESGQRTVAGVLCAIAHLCEVAQKRLDGPKEPDDGRGHECAGGLPYEHSERTDSP